MLCFLMTRANLSAYETSGLALLLQQVLQELVGDKSLERFRVEYEKLFRTLKKSHGKATPKA